ncbi:hypothetical protein ACJX0J_008631, partial [Zea mays]
NYYFLNGIQMLKFISHIYIFFFIITLVYKQPRAQRRIFFEINIIFLLQTKLNEQAKLAQQAFHPSLDNELMKHPIIHLQHITQCFHGSLKEEELSCSQQQAYEGIPKKNMFQGHKLVTTFLYGCAKTCRVSDMCNQFAYSLFTTFSNAIFGLHTHLTTTLPYLDSGTSFSASCSFMMNECHIC